MLKISNQEVEKLAQHEDDEDNEEREFREGIREIMRKRKNQVPDLTKIDSMEDMDIY